MTYDDVIAFIEGGRYLNTKPFSTMKESRDKYLAYHAEEGRLVELFKADCRQLVVTKVGVDCPDGFNKLFAYAWSEGHASGLHEVLYWIDEMAGVVGAFTSYYRGEVKDDNQK
jgi:hypothetical protein